MRKYFSRDLSSLSVSRKCQATVHVCRPVWMEASEAGYSYGLQQPSKTYEPTHMAQGRRQKFLLTHRHSDNIYNYTVYTSVYPRTYLYIYMPLYLCTYIYLCVYAPQRGRPVRKDATDARYACGLQQHSHRPRSCNSRLDENVARTGNGKNDEKNPSLDKLQQL